MRLFKILKKPVQTEKTSNAQIQNNTYVFLVDNTATKIDVKKAVSEIYGFTVESVNILNTREKFKFGKKRTMQVRKRAGRKAYVTLKDKKANLDFSVVK